MAQHDYVIANGTGAAVRSDLNNALAAIVSQNSGATAPATTYAFQFWADTTTGLLKLRNSANSAWITLFQLDGEWSTLPVENGTAAAPSIYFKDSGTDTGFYSPGTDQVGISTGGTARLTIDANGNLAVDTNSLYVDAANNRVGIGTSSPGQVLDVQANDARFNLTSTGSGQTVGISIKGGGGGGDTYNYIESLDSTGSQKWYIGSNGTANTLAFKTNGNNERMRIDSSGRVGIGTTSPGTYGQFAVRGAAATGSYGNVSGHFSDASTGSFFIGHASNTLKLFTDTSNLTFGFSNSEAARIDSSGRLLVGTSTAGSALDRTIELHNAGTSLAQPSYHIFSYPGTSSTNRGYFQFNRSRGTSVGDKTIVASGDALGTIYWNAGDGSSWTQAAEISAYVDGTPGANDMPGRLVFSTTADGATSPTERVRITNGGYVKAANNGTYVDATGGKHEFHTNGADHTMLQRNTHGSNPYGLRIDYTSDPNNTGFPFLFCASNTNTVRAEIRSNGGLANYQANNVNFSDRNAKKDISPAAGTWDCIKEWEIVNYRYKDQPDDADLNLGVIAQQVAENCPEVITVFKEATEDQPKMLGVKEQQMYWMAIKALQEAQVRIEALEAEVAALKAQ